MVTFASAATFELDAFCSIVDRSHPWLCEFVIVTENVMTCISQKISCINEGLRAFLVLCISVIIVCKFFARIVTTESFCNDSHKETLHG